MKKVLLIAAATLLCIPAFSQVKTVLLNIDGTYDIVVQVGRNSYVTLSESGEILNFEIPERVNPDGTQPGKEYHGDKESHKAGKIKRVNNIDFDYHTMAYEERGGKAKKIGNVNFDYYHRNKHRPEQAGKLHKAGSTVFEYYDSEYGEKEGKIRRIGNIDMDYYAPKDTPYRSSTRETEKYGLLRSVKGHEYDYLVETDPETGIKKTMQGDGEVKVGVVTVHVLNPEIF